MKFALKLAAASVALAVAGGAFAQKGETVKIAFIDPSATENCLIELAELPAGAGHHAIG